MRTTMLIAVLGAALAIVPAVPGRASSDGAWNSLDQKAHTACSVEIRRLAPRARLSLVTGRVLGIGGTGDQYYALTLRGKDGGVTASWLCLFDKRTQTAQAREISN